jgi:hypothetical protein
MRCRPRALEQVVASFARDHRILRLFAVGLFEFFVFFPFSVVFGFLAVLEKEVCGFRRVSFFRESDLPG